MSDTFVFIATVFVGAVAGMLGGMFGIGGAAVSTPAIRALGATAFESVGSTLPGVLPSTLISTVRYHRARKIDWNIARTLALFGCVMAVAGAVTARAIPGDGHVLMIITAAFVGFGGARVVNQKVPDENEEPHTPATNNIIAGIGAGSGFLAGLLGLGGGVVMVPMLHTWGRLSTKTSIATSLAAQNAFVVPAIATHALLGNINWAFAIPLAIGPLIGTPIGTHIMLGTKEHLMKLLVGWALIAVALIYGAAELIAFMEHV